MTTTPTDLSTILGATRRADGHPGNGYAAEGTAAAENMMLRARMEHLPRIEQAKGILMGRFGVDAETAFDLLRQWSSHTNIKVRDLSRILTETVATAFNRDAPTRSGPARSDPAGSGQATSAEMLSWLRQFS